MKSYVKGRVTELLTYLLQLPGFLLDDKQLCIQALELHASRNVSLADAWHAAFMHERGLTEIYTWDTDFDRFSGIVRVEPTID